VVVSDKLSAQWASRLSMTFDKISLPAFRLGLGYLFSIFASISCHVFSFSNCAATFIGAYFQRSS
jgi:hypothetical protein